MIDANDSNKLGKELTNNYPLVVFGMAKSTLQIDSGSKVSSVAVTAVYVNGCDIRATLCRGDLCETKTSFYKFDPPLRSKNELSERILSDVRNRVCAPNPIWLVTDPLALFILVICGFLAYGTYVGVEDMTNAFVQHPRIERTLTAIFGSPRTFSYSICGAFWFSVVAHGIEATVGVHNAVKLLELGMVPASLWGVMIFLVGYPIFRRLQELISIERARVKSKHND